MNRRDTLVALFALGAVPGVVDAQPAPTRLAWIGSGTAEGGAAALTAFHDGLRDQGLAEGKNYVLDLFWSDGIYERFPALLEAALARKPSIILVTTIASVRAAQKATKTVPIVFASVNDPVGNGLVASLARPGGNTTGTATMNDDRAMKLVEYVRETLPKARRLAVLINPLNPSSRPILELLHQAAAGRSMVAESFEAGTPDDIGNAFTALSKTRPDALLAGFDSMHSDQRAQITVLALAHRIPLFAGSPNYTDAGGLLGFGPPSWANYRRAAHYVKKILSGAKPADLPVEQPTQFELVVNLKTAKALGLTLPQSILLRADRVIE